MSRIDTSAADAVQAQVEELTRVLVRKFLFITYEFLDHAQGINITSADFLLMAAAEARAKEDESLKNFLEEEPIQRAWAAMSLPTDIT